jgi:hypothetical protein
MMAVEVHERLLRLVSAAAAAVPVASAFVAVIIAAFAAAFATVRVLATSGAAAVSDSPTATVAAVSALLSQQVL